VPSLTFVFSVPFLPFQRCLRRSERVSTPETWLASPGSYLILLKLSERTNADSEILNSVHLSGVVLCPLPGPTASHHPSQSPAQMESVSIISINSANLPNCRTCLGVMPGDQPRDVCIFPEHKFPLTDGFVNCEAIIPRQDFGFATRKTRFTTLTPSI
jgi:hypothetical protein